MPRDLLTPPPATKVGESNGRFLGYVANGMSRSEIEQRWKDGEFPELHHGLAASAIKEAGL